jgi:hypothetical protein
MLNRSPSSSRIDGTGAAVEGPQIVEIAFEPVVLERRTQQAVAPQDEPRPTLPRPSAARAGLFQGWGPRL